MLKKLNILLKKQWLYYFFKIWQSYSKFKLDAKQAKAILKKHKEAAKKQN